MLVSSVPFDHHDGLGKTSYGADRIKDTRHPVPRERRVHLDGKAFTCEVVDDVERSDPSATL